MRKAAKIYDVIESLVAGLEAFVATSRNNERVTGGNGLRHHLPQFDRDGPVVAMVFYFHA